MYMKSGNLPSDRARSQLEIRIEQGMVAGLSGERNLPLWNLGKLHTASHAASNLASQKLAFRVM
jgi:hypothetical protein